MDHYTIEVINKTAAQQNYFFFAETPQLSDSSTTVFTNAFSVAITPVGETSTAKISKQVYAIVGSSSGSLTAGETVSTGGHVPVTLGKSGQPGTTLPFKIDGGAPQFGAASDPASNSGDNGAFCIKTESFDPLAATDGHWVVGVGSASAGDDSAGACITFRPQPATTYQIYPKPIYYLSYGSVTQGTVIDTKTIGPSCAIDFTDGTFDQASITHDKNGFTVSKDT